MVPRGAQWLLERDGRGSNCPRGPREGAPSEAKKVEKKKIEFFFYRLDFRNVHFVLQHNKMPCHTFRVKILYQVFKIPKFVHYW